MDASRRGAQRRWCGRVTFGLAAAIAALVLVGVPPRSLGASASPAPPPPSPLTTRALWVLRSTLTSPERIDRLVQQAAEGDFNTLFLQVRGRGDAFYAGSLEPRGEGVAPGFDPLAHALTRAHAAGLRVHIWINVNLVASVVRLPTDPAHLIHTHPEWLMVPRELARSAATTSARDRRYVARLAAWVRARSDRIEGLYVSPVPVEAARYVESIVADLATRYPIDGLHLDYIRYPGPQFDYSPAALAAFRRSLVPEVDADLRARLDRRLPREPLVYADYFSGRWTQYRRARLADLVARLRSAVMARRPQAWISAAVVPDAGEAARDRMQDWPDWARRGLVDALCPMAYTADLPRFTRQIGEVGAAAGGQPVWAGIGAYRMTPSQTVRHIAAARAAGAQGVVLFSYDSIAGDVPGDRLGQIGRAAFADAASVASSR